MGAEDKTQAAAAPAAEEITIEESFGRLDEILDKMEDQETGLEESFRLYEEGLRLIRRAEGAIDRVEKKIRILNGEGSGTDEL